MAIIQRFDNILSCHSSVGGVCNFLTYVSLQQRIEMVDQCYSSITAQSFIRQAKESTPSSREGGPTSKERLNLLLASSFYSFVSFPLEPALCKLALVRSAVLPEVLTLVLRPFFDLPLFYYCGLFLSLSFSHCHFGLLFPILTT